MDFNKKVDFHAHYLSPTYYKYLKTYVGENPDGFPTPVWTAQKHLKLAKKLGVAFSFLSVSSPNLSGADADTEMKMVRKINMEGYKIVRKYPDQFGLFACLPLPHTDAAVKEARFALHKLKADGFGLSTHYAGIYLGDSRYDPLMEYLNRENAVVAIHPVKPSDLPKGVNEELPIPAMEFFMDTTRTFTNMVMHDIFGRYPNIRWIFPHGGAFISVLSDRLASFSVQMRSGLKQNVPLDFKGDMRHVYFDLAGFSVPKQIEDLLKDVKVENLVYGSDTPYTPDFGCIALSGALEDCTVLRENEKNSVFTDNAVRLIPRLGPILGVNVKGTDVTYRSHGLTRQEKNLRNMRKLLGKAYGFITK